MNLETLVYEKEDRIATLTLNRPKSGNALSRRLRDELDHLARSRLFTSAAGSDE